MQLWDKNAGSGQSSVCLLPVSYFWALALAVNKAASNVSDEVEHQLWMRASVINVRSGIKWIDFIDLIWTVNNSPIPWA